MRLSLLPLPFVLLACGAPDSGADRQLVALQEASCTSAIADHVRRPEAQVATRWLSTTDGIATVEAIDDARRHLCLVDAQGRVIDYLHPDA